MSDGDLLIQLRAALEQGDDEKLIQMCDRIASEDSVCLPVLFTLLAHYERIVFTECDTWHERSSNSAWVRALTKHWNQLMTELREVEIIRGARPRSLSSTPLTSLDYGSLLTGFSSLSTAEAREGFLSMVGDDDFLDRLARTDKYLLTKLMSWLCRTDLPDLDDVVESLLDLSRARYCRELRREEDVVLIRATLGAVGHYLRSDCIWDPSPRFRPSMLKFRSVVIEGLKRGVPLGDDTLGMLFSNQYHPLPEGVLSLVKEVVGNSRYSVELQRVTVEMLELFLIEVDPISTY